MIAELHIETKQRDNITYLKKVYCTPPFKVADIREDKKDATLQLMLMSSSPGILDGDEYRIKIDLDEGGQLSLATQSYQRLFAMKTGAIQNMEVRMGNNASFTYLPHPCVPHEGSTFKSKSKIYLADGCSLIWGEVLTCGRKLSGEVFLFNEYHNLTEIYINNRIIIKENLLMKPAQINVSAMGQLENHTHQGTLIYLNEVANIKALRQSFTELLSAQAQITFGITDTQKNGLMVRILGFKAEQLHNCLKNMAAIIHTSQNKLNPACIAS